MKNLYILLCLLSYATYTFAQSKNSNAGLSKGSQDTSRKDTVDDDGLSEKPFIEPSTQAIVYNFKTGKYEGNLKQIRVHTPVIFEIRNINPFAYKIKITPKDSVIAASSFDKSMLQWISKNELQAAEEKIDKAEIAQNTQITKGDAVVNQDFADSKNAVGGKALNAVNSGRQLAAENSASIAEVERLQKELNEIETQITLTLTKENDTNEIQQDVNSPDNALKDLIAEKNNLNAKIKEYQDSIKRKTDSANATMKHFVGLYNDFMTSYSNYMIDCQRVFRIVRNTKLLTTMAEDPGLSDSLTWNYKNNFQKILIEIRDDRNHFNNFRKTYSELNNLHALLKYDPELQGLLKQSGIDKLYAYPDYIKGKADELHSRLVEIPVETYMKQSEWIATKFNSEEAFVYRSAPLQPINDWIEFKVDIAQKNGSVSKDYYKERSFIFHQPTYGGTRVDFSLGLAGSYFWNTPIYDLGYESPSDSSRLVVYEKANKFIAPSLVGLVTMSVRRTKYVAFGGSAGLGIDVLNGKVQLSNFFIGPTALLGKFDRIFITGGASLRNVQQLERGYQVMESAGAATRISSILVDKYKVGIFLSVTYSLTDNAKKMLQSF